MSSYLKKDLVWWREVPVDVEWGLLDFLADCWIGDIYIVCITGYENERKSCGWSNQNNKKIKMIIEDEADPPTIQTIESFCSKDVIHLFSGVRGKHRKYLDLVNKCKHPNAKCMLIAESPSIYGSGIKLILKRIVYHMLYFGLHAKYEKVFSVFFTLGRMTDKIYSTYGWNKTMMVPFMYLPRFKSAKPNISPISKIKFLYLGRFSDETKGVFLMRDAFEAIGDTKNWHLDIVGGYGEQSSELIDWASKTNNVEFAGKWDASQVDVNMNKYDVCIVPSRYDGWNMIPYQALCAGVACIVSDNAGSDMLVKHGKYGEVFRANDANALVSILKKVISDPKIVDQWKRNAEEYQKKINQGMVGQYFLECVAFATNERKSKPICPWE